MRCWLNDISTSGAGGDVPSSSPAEQALVRVTNAIDATAITRRPGTGPVCTLGAVLSSYRRVLIVPGAWQFSLAGFFGRLPIAMVSLGIVLLVSAREGSYGLAGTVTATYLLANAALAIVHGRLVDRFGQHRVLPVVQTMFVLALSLMMWAVEDGWHPLLIHGLAAVAGASLPQIGACVRARLVVRARRRDPDPDGVRVRVRGRRGALRDRPDRGDLPGHRVGPGGRARRGDGLRAGRGPLARRPAPHRAAGPPAAASGTTGRP